MKMESRSIGLISKNTNCTCSTLFSNSRKTNLHVQHAFWLSLPLFCTTTTLFCMTKSSNFLVTHYFYGGIVVRLFCLPCSYSYFSLPLIFTLLPAPCWPLAFLIRAIYTRKIRRELDHFYEYVYENSSYKWLASYFYSWLVFMWMNRTYFLSVCL